MCLRRWLRGPELDEAYARATEVPQKPVVPAAPPRAASHEGHVEPKARPPAGLPTPEPTKAIAPAPPKETRPPAALPTPEPTKATAPAPLERLAAEMPEAPATGTPWRERPDEVTAVLTSVLDSLGAAHHRPFSRS